MHEDDNMCLITVSVADSEELQDKIQSGDDNSAHSELGTGWSVQVKKNKLLFVGTFQQKRNYL